MVNWNFSGQKIDQDIGVKKSLHRSHSDRSLRMYSTESIFPFKLPNAGSFAKRLFRGLAGRKAATAWRTTSVRETLCFLLYRSRAWICSLGRLTMVRTTISCHDITKRSTRSVAYVSRCSRNNAIVRAKASAEASGAKLSRSSQLNPWPAS